MILENGWKWEANEIDPQKSQLVEGAAVLGRGDLPLVQRAPHKVQHLLHATFSNIEHQSIEFVRDACTPWCRRLEQEADYKLFPQDRAPWRTPASTSMPLKDGRREVARRGLRAVWRQNGIKTANEIREREGMDTPGPRATCCCAEQNADQPIEASQAARAPAALPALPPVDDPLATGEDPTAPPTARMPSTVAREALITILVGMALEPVLPPAEEPPRRPRAKKLARTRSSGASRRPPEHVLPQLSPSSRRRSRSPAHAGALPEPRTCSGRARARRRRHAPAIAAAKALPRELSTARVRLRRVDDEALHS
jgi:hypothetical protein